MATVKSVIGSMFLLSLLTGCGVEDTTSKTGNASLKTKDIYIQKKDVHLEQQPLDLEGKGTYVGQMDPHSIEISIDGVPTAFQLTDQAISQLSSIQDGTDVEFVYTDTDKEQKTIERFVKAEGEIHLIHSVLQLDQELTDLVIKLHDTKESSILKDMSAFEIFAMYMYTKAGQDFDTLYYFHELDSHSISVEQFKKENMTQEAISQNDSFMKKLDQVRKFKVIQTGDNRAMVSFQLPNEEHVYEFKLIKTSNGWHAMWIPFQ
ncbi:hypothetical protein [Robertmurraya korlensis]|uniref:hypothetical protein n=1 Tax=Robertmurraya korlensis TaxID=519977 RepID=UPI000826125C|nr:hypothetical protein [Robertmurraya korlensis]